jgi:orotate phosphoribosyltransferase
MDRRELAVKIYEIASITGEFKLRSGITSNQYFDKYRFEGQPLILKAIAEHMAKMVPPSTEVIAGLEMGGIPIATMISQITGLPTCFVRKKSKTYGTCQFAEGAEIVGKRVLIIEDVVTSGGQAILSTADLRRMHAHIEDVLCVIDREQGGFHKLETAGMHLHSLFKRSELESAANQP